MCDGWGGGELLVLLTAQTDEQYHGRKGGGGGEEGSLADLYNACVAQLSNESKRIGSANVLSTSLLPLSPPTHGNFRRSCNNKPSELPPLLLATSCDARVSCCQLIFNFGARILKIFYKY